MKSLYIKTFSDKKYADEFLYKGAVFFRSATQFAKMENDSRQDTDEGRETYMLNSKFFDENGNPKLRNYNPSKNIISGKFQFVGTVKDYVEETTDENKKLVFDKETDDLIYSITYIDEDKCIKNLDISKFGEHAIVVFDAQEFEKRILQCFDKNNLKYCKGKVKYYASRTNNLHTLFRKLDKYKGEFEYRYVVTNSKTQTLLLNLGDISDIAFYVNCNKLEKYIQNNSFPNSEDICRQFL